jgi:hypothetical protein
LTKPETPDGKPAAKATRNLIECRANIAIGRGAHAIVLTNQNGAVLELSGFERARCLVPAFAGAD